MYVTMTEFCTVGFISPVMVKSCHSPAKLRIVNLLVLCEKLQRKSILTLYLYHFVSFLLIPQTIHRIGAGGLCSFEADRKQCGDNGCYTG